MEKNTKNIIFSVIIGISIFVFTYTFFNLALNYISLFDLKKLLSYSLIEETINLNKSIYLSIIIFTLTTTVIFIFSLFVKDKVLDLVVIICQFILILSFILFIFISRKQINELSLSLISLMQQSLLKLAVSLIFINIYCVVNYLKKYNV